jgi:hypothetical protein
MEYIAFDAHKHYTLASVARPDGIVPLAETSQDAAYGGRPGVPSRNSNP